MKKTLFVSLLFCLGFKLFATTILPTPEVMEIRKGKFTLNTRTKVFYDDSSCEEAKYFIGKVRPSLGYELQKVPLTTQPHKGIIFTTQGADPSLGAEGYTMEIEKRRIIIRAKTSKGIFYGIQSLLQVFPPEIYTNQEVKDIEWTASCLFVKDKPKYSWRGFMLDSGRQYQTVEFIKSYLDHLAMMKMNVFHWHLTDGIGWRIEIKKYPKLHEVGSKVVDGKEQQGYYTQEEIRDIVAYAAARKITVVPEIDVPGHSEAALMAYPEFSCFGKAPSTTMAFTSTLFCGGQEKTYEFLQDVFSEICDLFPGPYVHIGGDEAPKGNWNKCPHCQAMIKKQGLKDSHDLQIYFTNRLARFLKKKGKKAICWGDVVHHPGSELEDNVVVQWWNWRGHKDKALKESLRRGHEVICSTNYYCYLNFPVTSWSRYAANRTFNLKMTYESNPSDLKDLSQKEKELVMGMGCCLWTDWFVQQNMIDRRVFPRIFSLAEQMWHVGERLPFEQFLMKVKEVTPRLKVLGVDYGPAMEEEVPEGFKWD